MCAYIYTNKTYPYLQRSSTVLLTATTIKDRPPERHGAFPIGVFESSIDRNPFSVGRVHHEGFDTKGK